MIFPTLFWSLVLLLVLHPASNAIAKQTYIVHVDHKQKPSSYATDRDWYHACLQSDHLQSDTSDSPSLLYTYTNVYHGFAASLDSDQAESLVQDGFVLGVYEDTIYNLQTTRTPEFLGLQTDATHPGIPGMKNIEMASMDVIIGVLDSGIWPESKSFDDSHMKPVPARWKGKCESGVTCNRKLIGARSFSEGIRDGTDILIGADTPRDEDGHGTHTASTAAGSPVANASFFGYARGTARGMATGARIAVYKVCWKTRCFSSDILAGLDSAIADGVDVLSLSIGGEAKPYFQDTLAIGAFSAVEKGIFVSCAAGNNGPRSASIVNVAPWIMTVGAGTIDRSFPASALLGNGKSYVGTSLYVGPGITKPVALVYNNTDTNTRSCLPGYVNPSWVRGKVVLCDRGVTGRAAKGALVRNAGALGMILANTADNGEGLDADSHLLPAVAVGKKAGDLIRAYVLSGGNPTAELSFRGTVLNVSPAPVVAGFTSRGPNLVTPQILKPDLIAPGSNILAAWTGSAGPTGLDSDSRRTQYNIISGTSMSCPHISGLAALVKAAHPGWSPSAIKSALMTTSYTVDNTKFPLRDAADGSLSTAWAHGSGHVDIRRALDPGLVYDIKMKDYIKFICSLNYSINEVMTIVKDPNITCSRQFKDPGQLNYPSFSVLFAEKKKKIQYARVVSNVGPANSVYNVTVTGPKEVSVTVSPARLVFTKAGQTLKYRVTFITKNGTSDGAKFGSLTWKSRKHQARSAISYQWSQP